MKVSRTAITVDLITESLKKNLDQAQIRQVVTTTYPSAKITSNMQDNVFTDKDCLIEGQSFDENRVAFISVPKGTDKVTVEKQLAAHPDACIYKVLSLKPILTDNDKAAIQAQLVDNNQQIITEESIGKKQLVIDADNKQVLYNNLPVYRRTFFSSVAKEDIDTRVEDMKTVLTPTSVITPSVVEKAEEVAAKM